MLYRKTTQKSVGQAFEDLQASCKAHGFGVLHHYDFKQTLQSKGFELANECLVVEVCDPKQASEVLAADMSLNMALPCRISIYRDAGQTIIGMVPPTAMLGLVSDDPGIAQTAQVVEQKMQAIIDEAL